MRPVSSLQTGTPIIGNKVKTQKPKPAVFAQEAVVTPPAERLELSGALPATEPKPVESVKTQTAPARTEAPPTTLLDFSAGAVGSDLLNNSGTTAPAASGDHPPADPIGDGSNEVTRRTVGWAGEPSEQVGIGQTHRRQVSRGIKLMDELAPGLRKRLDQLTEENPDPKLKAKSDALVDEQTQIYTQHGKLMSMPEDVVAQKSPKDAELRRQLGQRTAALEAEWEANNSEVQSLKLANNRKAKDLAVVFLGRLRGNASERNPADAVTFHPSALKALKEQGISQDDVKKWVNEFHHQTGLPVPDKLEFRHDGPRPAYHSDKDYINIGDKFSKRLVLHEVAHRAEYRNPEVSQGNKEWVRARARAAGNSTTEPTPMTKLAPDSSTYTKDEVALENHFVDPYVGKQYPDSATEVLSVGLEHFESPEKMLKLYKRDPEHFFLTLGSIESLKRGGW